ncbi:hypothetical protein Dimus_032598 [Dionaea muscipula]
MGSPSVVVHSPSLPPMSLHPPSHHYKHNKLSLARPHPPPFLPSKSLSSSPAISIRPSSITRRSRINPRSSRATAPVIVAAQSNFVRVVRTVIRVGKDGIEAGANLVPDSIPRPIARISLTVVAAAVFLFILKSLLSTAFFALGVMGFVYFVYLALYKDKGSRVDTGSTSTDDAVEEAKRIMEKYK